MKESVLDLQQTQPVCDIINLVALKIDRSYELISMALVSVARK